MNKTLTGPMRLVALASILLIVFLNFEPTITDAATAGSEEIVNLEVTTEISISNPAGDVTMSPSIAGMTGGEANGSTTFTVKTNNLAGFDMKIKASTSRLLGSDRRHS
jgi:hypothetical protein